VYDCIVVRPLPERPLEDNPEGELDGESDGEEEDEYADNVVSSKQALDTKSRKSI
jgi:hypothetical protein